MRYSIKQGVVTNFTGHLCQSLFFDKVAAFRPQVFFCEFAKFVRMLFSQNNSERTASVKYIFLKVADVIFNAFISKLTDANCF